MSYISDTKSRIRDSFIQPQQQPDFPLVYDHIYGPYKPITSREKSYQRNFINLLLTNPGEWPMKPDLGVGLRRCLFEFTTSDHFNGLKSKRAGQLQKYLPQIKLMDLKYATEPEDLDNNKIKIVLVYAILNTVVFASSFSLNSQNQVFIEELDKFEAKKPDFFRKGVSYTSDEREV